MKPKLVKLENGDYVNINYIKALSSVTGDAYLVRDDPAKGQAVHLTDKDREKVIQAMGVINPTVNDVDTLYQIKVKSTIEEYDDQYLVVETNPKGEKAIQWVSKSQLNTQTDKNCQILFTYNEAMKVMDKQNMVPVIQAQFSV